MPRKLRQAKLRRPSGDVPPLVAFVFECGDLPIDRAAYGSDEVRQAWTLCQTTPDRRCWRFDRFVTAWEGAREAVLSTWIAERPGSRPFAWWLVDAPRAAGGIRPEPRQWVSGVPTVDASFNDSLALARRAGRPVPSPHRLSRLESEASYLRRHGLLGADERRRLSPDAFDPVCAADADDEEAA